MAQSVDTLTIANGQTISNVLELHGAWGARAQTLNIIVPGTLPDTVHIELGDAVAGNYGRLQCGATDIVLTAGKAIPIDSIVSVTLRLVATGLVAGDRSFIVIRSSRAYE